MATRKNDEGLDGIVHRVFSHHRAWQMLGLIAGTLDAAQRDRTRKSDVAADKMLDAVLAAADQYFTKRILGDVIERLQFRQVQELEKIYRDVRSGKTPQRRQTVEGRSALAPSRQLRPGVST